VRTYARHGYARTSHTTNPLLLRRIFMEIINMSDEEKFEIDVEFINKLQALKQNIHYIVEAGKAEEKFNRLVDKWNKQCDEVKKLGVELEEETKRHNLTINGQNVVIMEKEKLITQLQLEISQLRMARTTLVVNNER